MAKFYITNAIPYVNAKPHIGHALEFIQSDTIARFHKISGDEVLLLCGADENAVKNVQSAKKEGRQISEFINENAKHFENLAKALSVEFDVFQRGSSDDHHKASQKLWELCDKSGDIYKKAYKGLYCVGCEEFKTKEDLNENGQCPEHPGKKLDEVSEENYFFRLSAYQDKILEIVESNKYVIVPEFRRNEVLSFIKSGLQDFSISRSNARAHNWGVEVPGDPTQKIYVWFDALNIYQSGIGFYSNLEKYNKWWPADLHVIGKGIIRFHAVYWPAILLSAGLALPKTLFVHEYFTVNGQKMSKTLGNVIDPMEMIKKYGADALRYYCLAKISPFQDGDFSEEKLKEAYNADLANGLGNLVSRVARLCESNSIEVDEKKASIIPEVEQRLNEYKFNEALYVVWRKIQEADIYINEVKPWEMEGEKLKDVLIDLSNRIRTIAYNLKPFLPETSEKILKQFSGNIKSDAPLFPRIN